MKGPLEAAGGRVAAISSDVSDSVVGRAQQMFCLGNTHFLDIIKYCFSGVFFKITAEVFPGKVHVGSK